MTKLTNDDLDRRFDGPVPQRLRDVVIHGSALKADIAEMEGLIAAFNDHLRRAANAYGVAFARFDELRAASAAKSCSEYRATLARLNGQLSAMYKRLPR